MSCSRTQHSDAVEAQLSYEVLSGSVKYHVFLRKEFNFWNIRGIMNTSGLLQGFTLTLQETRSIHDYMNIPEIEFIAYIYILL